MLHDIILFFVGILVGVMNAIAGGGMLIGFPVMLAVGLPPLIANATSNIVVLPGNISAAYGYRKLLRKVPRQYLLLLLPAIVGAAIGATILRHTSSNSFEHLIPGLILFAVVLFTFQPLLYNLLHNHLHGPKRLRNSLQPILIVGLALIPLAIYGGYFGAGFGFIMLAFLGFTKLRTHIHQMNALKNIITVFIAATSLACLYSSHLIDWRHGLAMGGGNLIGGYYGAIGAQKVSSHVLRIIVIIIGISTAIYLGLRTY
jgi:uncharacterized membrane protein YfcA